MCAVGPWRGSCLCQVFNYSTPLSRVTISFPLDGGHFQNGPRVSFVCFLEAHLPVISSETFPHSVLPLWRPLSVCTLGSFATLPNPPPHTTLQLVSIFCIAGNSCRSLGWAHRAPLQLLTHTHFALLSMLAHFKSHTPTRAKTLIHAAYNRMLCHLLVLCG